ncbi:hypothetical protein [Streptomyces sp. YIM S03343]
MTAFAGRAVDPQHPATVMVTTLDRWWPSDEFHRSADGGATWKTLGAISVRNDSAAPYVGTGIGPWMGAPAIDPFDSGQRLYGTGSGMWGGSPAPRASTSPRGRRSSWCGSAAATHGTGGGSAAVIRDESPQKRGTPADARLGFLEVVSVDQAGQRFRVRMPGRYGRLS